jgi:hypothetical protein
MKYIILLLTCLSLKAASPSITVAWDAPLSTNIIVGYRVYFKTNQAIPYSVFQITSQLQHTVSNLTYNAAYYFAVKAVDNNGLVSDFSEEISGSTPVVLPPDPPRNLRIITSSVQESSSTSGPWTNISEYAIGIPILTNTSKVHRTKLEIK